jgi:hypothetical protein
MGGMSAAPESNGSRPLVGVVLLSCAVLLTVAGGCLMAQGGRAVDPEAQAVSNLLGILALAFALPVWATAALILLRRAPRILWLVPSALAFLLGAWLVALWRL